MESNHKNPTIDDHTLLWVNNALTQLNEIIKWIELNGYSTLSGLNIPIFRIKFNFYETLRRDTLKG